MFRILSLYFCIAGLSFGTCLADEFIPRRQDKPPGPPLSPQAAIEKMTVPEGFTVELVAAEPMLQNPVAMCFDERGRIWVTESFEYPRKEPGPGRDRIKVLEDTTGDGVADKMTIFADGLNIPSGIAVGHGGVWVANAPDILLLRDTDGDLKADTKEVIVTGFGRTDTHELPNSLTWGPDGWLYGLNGVFNYCDVSYPESNPNYRPDQASIKFNAAVFRIHPRTHRFELFAEGTSNPWGIAFDNRGEMFLSACVIDHLWHITQGGYYHRQAGAYPPFTWKIESIVDYKHQMAAYCGIAYFDSPAYPEKYRNKLYMGNIHGGCINVDGLERNGSTYKGVKHDDFLTANDVWFMPVAQKTGPDGSLYILDWYDRYHCYQDANADPAGVDRGHGRLYRIRYKDTPRATDFNLAAKSFEELLPLLGDENVFVRKTAKRLLHEIAFQQILIPTERNVTLDWDVSKRTGLLREVVEDESKSLTERRNALDVLLAYPNLFRNDELVEFATHAEPDFRVAAMRALRNSQAINLSREQAVDRFGFETINEVKRQASEQQSLLIDLALQEADANLLLEVAKAVSTIDDPAFVADTLFKVQNQAGDDVLIPRMVWRKLERLITQQGAAAVLKSLNQQQATGFENLDPLLPRIAERILADQRTKPSTIGQLFSMFAVGETARPDVARECLNFLAERVKNRELQGASLSQLREEIDAAIVAIINDKPHPLRAESILLATSWNYEPAIQEAANWAVSAAEPDALRMQAIDAVCSADETRGVKIVDALFKDAGSVRPELLRTALDSAGRMKATSIADLVLNAYAQFPAVVQPNAIDLLTQRKPWSEALIAAVNAKAISREDVNATQLRRMLSIADEQLEKQITELWGKVRAQPKVERQRAIVRAARIIRNTPGDPHQGWAVYNRVCGQCHKLHGQGAEVGPDLTRNGRNNYAQLLSNVFDPNLVIGEAYQARTIVTLEGRVFTGLIAEDSDARVVLKLPGGKTATIPRDDIEFSKISDVSLMPEQLENQMTEEELADLFALLNLDKPPGDPAATQLAGVTHTQPVETAEPADYPQLVAQIAPGFELSGSGHRGVAWLNEFRNRRGVLRTHPINNKTPSVLTGNIEVPAGQSTKLLLKVAAHPRADWQLSIGINGKVVKTRAITSISSNDSGWETVTADLTPYAGEPVTVRLNASGLGRWNSEYAYWHVIDVVSERPQVTSQP